MLYKTYFFMNSSFKTIVKGKTCCEQQVQAPLYYTQIDKAPPLHKGDAYCIEIAYFLEFIFKQKHEHKIHNKQKQRNDAADQCLFVSGLRLRRDLHLFLFHHHGNGDAHGGERWADADGADADDGHGKRKLRKFFHRIRIFILFHDFHLPKHRIFQQHGLFFL